MANSAHRVGPSSGALVVNAARPDAGSLSISVSAGGGEQLESGVVMSP